MKEHFRSRTAAIAAVCALIAPSSSFGATAENVILMISDGASWGTVDMASYWEFGEKGRHSRSAVGVPVLPLGAAVEVDAVIAISPE